MRNVFNLRQVLHELAPEAPKGSDLQQLEDKLPKQETSVPNLDNSDLPPQVKENIQNYARNASTGDVDSMALFGDTAVKEPPLEEPLPKAEIPADVVEVPVATEMHTIPATAGKHTMSDITSMLSQSVQGNVVSAETVPDDTVDQLAETAFENSTIAASGEPVAEEPVAEALPDENIEVAYRENVKPEVLKEVDNTKPVTSALMDAVDTVEPTVMDIADVQAFTAPESKTKVTGSFSTTSVAHSKSASFMNLLEEEELEESVAPIVIDDIKDNSGKIKATFDKFCESHHEAVVPISALYNDVFASGISEVSGYTICSIFGTKLAFKQVVRKNVVQDLANQIIDIIKSGDVFRLQIRHDLELGRVYPSLSLTLKEISYIKSLFKNYNARVDITNDSASLVVGV